MNGRLQGKVALVTGAGSIGPGWGNGKATAVLFARAGARVVAVDINHVAAVETQAIIAGEGGECIVCTGDVSNAADVQAIVAQALATYGRIDILHNNVGIAPVGGPVETDEATWDRVLAVNLKSMFLTCKYVLPHMAAQGGGAIINLASVGGIRWVGIPYIAYSSSKAGVIQFTQSVALQYAAKNIRCNCILPGLMDTPMVHHALADFYADGDIDKMIELRTRQCPMGRMGDAWDVAQAALFLASDEAKYITGVQLPVDGGLSCTVVSPPVSGR